jgi:anti-anti-sigma factor
MLDVESLDQVTIIRVKSDLDIASVDTLESAIDLAASTSKLPIVVSLAACPYCDSTGLRLFVAASKKLAGRFALVVPPGSRCHRVFEITGLKKALPIYPTVESVPLATLEDALD